MRVFAMLLLVGGMAFWTIGCGGEPAGEPGQMDPGPAGVPPGQPEPSLEPGPEGAPGTGAHGDQFQEGAPAPHSGEPAFPAPTDDQQQGGFGQEGGFGVDPNDDAGVGEPFGDPQSAPPLDQGGSFPTDPGELPGSEEPFGDQQPPAVDAPPLQ